MPTKSAEKLPPSKIDNVIKLLRRKSGATLAALEKATGWKPHSVRAALTGLRKKGHEIERTKDTKGATVYRVVEVASK